MLHEEVARLCNEQINKEFFSAYLYLQFSCYYTDEGLDGFAHWFDVQAQEERDHARLFLQYLQHNSAPVTLQPIAQPQQQPDSFLSLLTASLQHEQSVTQSIYNIYEAAQRARDFRTMQFLDWFVKEQGEEEKSAEDLIQKFKLFASDARGLYLLNQELAARTYAAPTLTLE